MEELRRRIVEKIDGLDPYFVEWNNALVWVLKEIDKMLKTERK